MALPNLCFVLESGTDVRLVEGLRERCNLTVVARKLNDGIATFSQTPAMAIDTVFGPDSRSKYALFVCNYLKQQQNKFDFVIAQGYGFAAVGANLAHRLTGTPTAMLVCSPTEAYYRCRQLYPSLNKPFRSHELLGLGAIARLNATLGQQYIVLSQHLADVVCSHGGNKPIHSIPLYGVDTNLFVPPSEPKTAIKTQMGLPTTGSLIFFSSRVAPEKDSETLLIAFKNLLDKGRDIWLLHRSGGYQTFIKDAKQYGIGDRVIATDAVHPHKQLPLDYQACDLCIQSSRQEGLGFSPLEALSCGVPVIASAVGGLRETIVDGKTGWTYPVGNSDKLAGSIEMVLDNPDEAIQSAIRGRNLVVEKFDRQFVFTKLLELFANN
jgi:glycosyltransferase involved in cell wall biosynthesis